MTRKNKGKIGIWVATGIVTAAVLAGGLGILLAQRPTDQSTPSVSSSGTPTAEAVREGPCDVPGGNITAVPSDLAWETVGGFSWPVSPSLGPTAVEDGFPVCFSHSPVGAALAAPSMIFESLRQDPTTVIEFYAMDSPGKAAAVEDTEGMTSESQLRSMQSNGFSVAGFRVDEYTGDRALVYLVLATPDGRTGYRGLPFPMEWVDGDWRLKPLDTGKSGLPIDVLDGQFTRWSADG